MKLTCTNCGLSFDTMVAEISKDFVKCPHCNYWEDYSEKESILASTKIITCTKCSRSIDTTVAEISKDFVKCPHCNYWEDYSVKDAAIGQVTVPKNSRKKAEVEVSPRVRLIMGTVLVLLISAFGFYQLSQKITTKNVNKWISQGRLEHIKEKYLAIVAETHDTDADADADAKAKAKAKLETITDAVYEAKYKEGMDFLKSELMDSPDGINAPYVWQQYAEGHINFPTKDLIRLGRSNSISQKMTLDIIKLLNYNHLKYIRKFLSDLIDTFLNCEEGYEDCFYEYYNDIEFILTNVTHLNFNDLKPLIQHLIANKKYTEVFEVVALTNVTHLNFNDLKPLIQHLIANKKYTEVFEVVALTTDVPDEYADLKEIYDEASRLKPDIINLKQELSILNEDLSSELKDLEGCQTIHGEVHSLLDEKGIAKRYIITTGSEMAILNTMFFTFSSSGYFSMDVRVMPKITLTDSKGFTQNYSQYMRVENCDKEKVNELRRLISEQESILALKKERTQNISNEIDLFFNSEQNKVVAVIQE